MKLAVICPVFLVLTGFAFAADFHLTPGGGGRRDGSSWLDALDQSALATTINERMQPGDRLLLGGGTYAGVSLTIGNGGSAERPKIIEGVDQGKGLPVFSGIWSAEKPTNGSTALHFAPGVSHVSVKSVRLRGYVFGVHAPPVEGGVSRSHLTFDDVHIEQFRHGFYLSDCDDVRLTGCDLKRYTKHGFRFEQGCDRVILQHCIADCSEGDEAWEKLTELFPFGFLVNDKGAPNTAFVFEDCLAQNNLMPLQTTGYKNGDGFVVEANAVDVAFVRCRSIRNQDGGFDLKVRDVRLTDCLALRNYRGFRIWTTATLINCFSGWNATGLWCNGGPVTVKRSTFHALRDEAAQTDKEAAAQPVTLIDSLISATKLPQKKRGQGEVVLETTVVTDLEEAKFPRPDPEWDGRGDAFDSRAYPDKGYHSTAAR